MDRLNEHHARYFRVIAGAESMKQAREMLRAAP